MIISKHAAAQMQQAIPVGPGPGDGATAEVTPVKVKERVPRLVIHTDYGDRVLEIADETITIGRDIDADVRVDGIFIASRHAEIIRENGRVVLRRTGGLRSVKVRGRAVKEVELKDNDEIQIASESFVFHE
jgi:pSer/pThr/pTyr-binding forkhead associated (FHA) protein